MPKTMSLRFSSKRRGTIIGLAHDILLLQGGQSRDTHVVISHFLFIEGLLDNYFLGFWRSSEMNTVQSTRTRMLFLMMLYF